MTHHTARIVGDLCYREGDGVEIKVPRGACEVEVTELDATLSWTDGRSHGSAAIPLAEFRRYVQSGVLQLDGEPADAGR